MTHRTPRKLGDRILVGILPALALAAAGCFGMAAASATEPTAAAVPDKPAEQVLAELGLDAITVTLTSDPTINCGAKISAQGKGGCFSTMRPDQIVISPELTGEVRHYVLLHEYAHYAQHRDGRALDECEADDLAVGWGANPELVQEGCD